MPFAKINGIDIHYETVGTGPNVLFIHGIGADMKNPMGILNSPLPDHFTVLAFDPRGLGESGDPEGPYTMADLADDAAALAAVVGWDSCHVFGASWGGMVAQELALRYPSLVDRLVMGVTNWGGAASPGNRMLEKLNEMPAAEKLKLSDTRKDEAWAAANPDLVRQAEERFRLAEEARKADSRLIRNFQYQAEAVMKHDAFDRLSDIKAPTLVFGGLYDGSNPPEITRAMAGQIPGARCELVESGHGDWYFDPKVWEMIVDFLNG